MLLVPFNINGAYRAHRANIFAGPASDANGLVHYRELRAFLV